jgi:predicted O-methyltransferase YrrM
MTGPAFFRPLALLAAMREIPGWLEDDEAELLIAGAAYVTRSAGARTLVEIGSYQGRSTVVIAGTLRALSPGSRLFAIDPHEGTVGAEDARLSRGTSTFERFIANIENAGVGACVRPLRALSYETDWTDPIDLLFVDGLHDRLNVERDFRHFEPFLTDDAVVLFHDYADYYPGVRDFVDELTRNGWRVGAGAGSMRLLQRD